MEARLEFKGTGAELFGTLIGGALLTAVTGGIYAPWFQVSLNKYICSVTTIRGTPRGDLRLEFTGTGWELFKIGFVGMLLTMLTLGIYAPWLIAELHRYYADHSIATSLAGTRYRLKSSVTGGDLLKTFLVGGLLSAITLGIYAPWFICKLQQMVARTTEVLEDERSIARLDFVGRGADLFVLMLMGNILTGLTLGIYFFWQQVRLLRFFAEGTEANFGGTAVRGAFTGAGGELFKLSLVGGILTGLTFGIYGFWFLARMLAFHFGNSVYRSMGGGPAPAQLPPGRVGLPGQPQPTL